MYVHCLYPIKIIMENIRKDVIEPATGRQTDDEDT